MNKEVVVNREELVQLAAVDHDFFERTFFPQTVRVPSASFHKNLINHMDSQHRYINCQIFRGGAKTSKTRTYIAKRIAYGLSRTILILGKSEAAAIRTLSWIKNNVEHNRRYADTFGLKPGSKWQDVEAQIEHTSLGITIWLIAMGITGSVRGINRDDFRPDLILGDDLCDDENSSTLEQRQKIEERIYGAVLQSMISPAENPDAKFIMLQTPLHEEDVSTKALNDQAWKSVVFPCWTPETLDRPVEEQESAWPSLYPSEYLRKEKTAMIARNMASVWYREFECKLVAPETSAFRSEWLKFYDLLPEVGSRVMVIDPVPPPSDSAIAKGLHNKDYECIMVLQRTGNDFYVVEYETRRGHDPSWTIATVFSLAAKWNPRKILVESVAYQRTLAWLLRRAMEQQSRWFVVEEFDDRRSKYQKIVDGLNGVSSAGHFYVRKNQTELIEQFSKYPNVSHDDVIECAALGVNELQEPEHSINARGEWIDDIDDNVPELVNCWGAP